jgi:peroxiredoxin
LNEHKRIPELFADAVMQAERLSGSLNHRLAAYREQSGRIRPDVARGYDKLVERLGMLDRDEIGPKLGEPMPPFHMPDETGRLTSLAELCAAGPVVISFNRGHWCPYCRLDLRSLAAIHRDVVRLGGQIVSIMPDSARYTSDSVSQDALPFPILSDMDLGYALSLGLIFSVGTEVKRLYEDLGIELERYQGNDSYFLPMAAKFIVGRDGLVKARQVNVEFRQRMEPAAILEALQRLRKQR